MIKKNFYHGTKNHIKLELKAKTTNQGVCLNLYDGFSTIKSTFHLAEHLNRPFFIDNGSFERFTYWRKRNATKTPKKRRISTEDYFSKDNAMTFFSNVLEEFKLILLHSKHQKNMIVTIPELIASSEITQYLQKKYIPLFRKLQIKYGFTPIISLQFNANSTE